MLHVQNENAQSLRVLEEAKRHGVLTKTSLMLGVGERPEEIEATLMDLRARGTLPRGQLAFAPIVQKLACLAKS